MITAYHRPRTTDEALKLLSQPGILPLGGGTWLNQPHEEKFGVVDLQSLGIDTLARKGNDLVIGATLTLQALLDAPETPEALKTAIKLEAPLNLRNMGTAAGTLVASDGRSPFAVGLLALDARLTILGGGPSISGLGELLPVRSEALKGKLITEITIPLNARMAFEYVARTPADRPIIAVAACQWSSGRTRLALGGFGKSALLGMDGADSTGLIAAARNACHEAADDWGTAEYRSAAAATLAKRCLDHIAAA